MNLVEWHSWYDEILADFGFEKSADEESANLLQKLLADHGLSPNDIPIKKNVIIFGAGPSLKENLLEFKQSHTENLTVICADGAVTALLEVDIVPDIVVTDLDGDIKDLLKSNQQGSIMVVHAHGNNMETLNKYVPKLDNILGTTQSTPIKDVYNFGGFTDGDRCLFLAKELGAKKIILAGMDFGKIVTKYSRPDIDGELGKADSVKQKKLQYAKKLVEWMAKNEDITICNVSNGERISSVKNIKFQDILMQK
jgi:2-amino-4-hydroxy-6-hydroxymethyldihydropteridine diphosphokinase